MHLNPHNNITPNFDFKNITDQVEVLKKDIEEIELNLKSNYNSMIADVTDFKYQLDFYLNTLKNCDQKLIFMLHSIQENAPILKTLIDLKTKLEDNKKQIELLLRMYDLKSKINLNRIQ